jgi:hypothetical protein
MDIESRHLHQVRIWNLDEVAPKGLLVRDEDFVTGFDVCVNHSRNSFISRKEREA